MNKGDAAIGRGKLMGKIFEIAVIPVLGGAMPVGTPVAVWGEVI